MENIYILLTVNKIKSQVSEFIVIFHLEFHFIFEQNHKISDVNHHPYFPKVEGRPRNLPRQNSAQSIAQCFISEIKRANIYTVENEPTIGAGLVLETVTLQYFSLR